MQPQLPLLSLGFPVQIRTRGVGRALESGVQQAPLAKGREQIRDDPSCARTEYMSMSSEIWRILDRLMHSYPEREKPTFSPKGLMKNLSSVYQRLTNTKLRYRIPPERGDSVAHLAPRHWCYVGFFVRIWQISLATKSYLQP